MCAVPSNADQPNAPVILLSHPQMGENIGAAARVMRNFGLRDLRLIAPRDGWPNEKSTALAAGAFQKMSPIRVFENTPLAISDMQMVFAVTARLRDMEKPVFSPKQAMAHMSDALASGALVGLLFGGEASGLSNEEVAACDGIITYPVHMEFASLNLAQAVGVASYAWQSFYTEGAAGKTPISKEQSGIAQRSELEGMLRQLRQELTDAGFFYPPEKAHVMMQNLQNMFVRNQMTSQEIKTFRGVIKALAHGRGAGLAQNK